MATVKEFYDSLFNEETEISIPWDGTEEDALLEVISFFFRLDLFVVPIDSPYQNISSDSYKKLKSVILDNFSHDYSDSPNLLSKIDDFLSGQGSVVKLGIERDRSDHLESATLAFVYILSISKDESIRLTQTLEKCSRAMNRNIDHWDEFIEYLVSLTSSSDVLYYFSEQKNK